MEARSLVISLPSSSHNKDKNIIIAVPNGYMGVLELPEGIVEWKDDAMWLEMGLNDLSHKFGTKLTVSEENTGLMIRDGDLVQK